MGQRTRRVSWLWTAPELNPENGKAYTIPILNPINIYGRCFHLAWLGFFVAFLSWFAFPPLMAKIEKNLDCDSNGENCKGNFAATGVSNSNIVGLCSTLLARFLIGPLCDKYGPRWALAGTLLIGAVPTAFVPLVNNISGIYAIRFFIGLLGGTFVPCQYWTTVLFDKKIVGRANALSGGWGNAGGGVAFFAMPAVMNSLRARGYTLEKSWKYSFDVCPLIIIIFVAIIILLFGVDCPEGKWSNRTVDTSIAVVEGSENYHQNNLRNTDSEKQIFKSPPAATLNPDSNHPTQPPIAPRVSLLKPKESRTIQPTTSTLSRLAPAISKLSRSGMAEDLTVTDPSATIEPPTLLSTMKVTFSPSTMLNAIPYATTFGGELAIESVISALYAAQAKKQGNNWSTQLAGDWGSMLGLLNVVFRPLGGYISDLLYDRWPTPWVKKIWMLTCGFLMGVFCLYTGLYKDISMAGVIVSLAFMSLFMEMGNGANFSLVPHTNPHHTGIVSGTTGAFGNAGGVLFSLAFRFSTFSNGSVDYMSALWYLGVAIMGTNVLCYFLPLAKV